MEILAAASHGHRRRLMMNIPTYVRTAISAAVVLLTSQLFAQQPRYKLVDLGTLGGPQSYIPDGGDVTAVGFLNDQGKLAAYADTARLDPFPVFCFVDDCQVTRALVAQKGV